MKQKNGLKIIITLLILFSSTAFVLNILLGIYFADYDILFITGRTILVPPLIISISIYYYHKVSRGEKIEWNYSERLLIPV